MQPEPLAIFRPQLEGFEVERYPLDLQGWGSDAPIFRQLIETVRPRLIIEVGTWKGASALHMAACCDELGFDTQILCIDTWLGAIEFWGDTEDRDRYQSLQRRHGYPSVYYQFLANVVHQGQTQRILAFPQTSAIAARWLARQQIQADLIYIDGSHECADVLADILAYRPLVRRGGILFGDDYDWPGVREAVDAAHIAVTLAGRHWVLPCK